MQEGDPWIVIPARSAEPLMMILVDRRSAKSADLVYGENVGTEVPLFVRPSAIFCGITALNGLSVREKAEIGGF